MSFQALKAQRARRAHWTPVRGASEAPTAPGTTAQDGGEASASGSESAPSHGASAEPPRAGAALDDAAADLYRVDGTDLVVERHPVWVRGMRLAPDAVAQRPGDTLLAQPTLVSVLATSQLGVRCHYCFAKPARLRQCTSCHVARYCDAACQAAAWTETRHRDECAALQAWFKEAPSADLAHEPGPTVRALAQMLWLRRKHGEKWWQPAAEMQSHRAQLSPAAQEEAAHLAYRLGRFLGDGDALAALGINRADELLELVCRHNTNAFTLSDAHLDPIGVCVLPTAALLNHACEPNAVVVFPTTSSGQRCPMHVVALRPIAPGERIWISYVDVATPRAERQRVLQERYHFTCACAACQAPPWRDPRTALWCTAPGCLGWRAPRDDGAWLACPYGHDAGTSPVQLDEAQRAADHVQACMRRGDVRAAEEACAAVLTPLSAVAPPSHHLMWILLHAAQVAAIERGAWDDALPLTLSLCAGMQAQGDRRAASTLYPRGHPQRAVLLATLGRLLAQPSGSPTPLAIRLDRALPVPTAPDQRWQLAYTALRQALEEASIGFGHGGGDVGALSRATLDVLEQERRVMVSS